MATTPEIRTRFTLDGMRNAVSGLRTFGERARETMQRLRSRAGAVMTPLINGIRNATTRMGALARATAGVTFRAMGRSATAAFRGIRLGAIGVAAAIAAIGTAAATSSSSIAEMLNRYAKDSRRLNTSTEDLATLQYAASRQGLDEDEIPIAISTLGFEFIEARDAIRLADEELDRFRKKIAPTAQAAARSGDQSALQSMYAEYEALALKSPAELSRRLQTATGSRRDELLAAQRELYMSGLGPGGEPLLELQRYGLDVDVLAKGGSEALYEFADAFRQVEDPATRLRYAMRLFGEDAGPKFVNMLMQGREGIERYRLELERFGALPTSEDAALGEGYDTSVQQRQQALNGARLAVARETLPLMTQFNERLAKLIAENRAALASLVAEGFDILGALIRDLQALFQGQREGFELSWIDGLVVGITRVRAFIALARGELELLLSGQNSQFGWLNVIRDGLLVVRDFAVDIFAIFSGGDAVEYRWLNDLRDDVVDFSQKLQDAFNLFLRVLQTIKDAVAPIFALFNVDVTTGLLVLGMLKFAGIIGGVVAILGTLTRGVTALFTGGAAAATGMATAVGGIVSSFAALAAGAALAGAAVGTYLGNQRNARWDAAIDQSVALNRSLADVGARRAHRNGMRDETYAARHWQSQGYDVKTPAERAAIRQHGVIDVWSGQGGIVDSRDSGIMKLSNPYAKTVQLDLNINGQRGRIIGDEDGVNFLVDSMQRAGRQGY